MCFHLLLALARFPWQESLSPALIAMEMLFKLDSLVEFSVPLPSALILDVEIKSLVFSSLEYLLATSIAQTQPCHHLNFAESGLL